VSIPSVWPDDHEADRQWRRRQLALTSLDPGDVLAEVDNLIAQEADPARHPLYGLVAYLLDQTNSPGSPQGLYERCKRLAGHAIARLVEQKLADPAAWEVD
jgi:hypothetical protein